MSRFLSTLAAVFLLSLAAGCGKREFTVLAPVGSGFKIEMPGVAKEQDRNLGVTQAKIFSVEERQAAFMASYCDLPVSYGEPEARVQSRLNGSRDGAILGVHGTFESDLRIQLAEGYPGREFFANVPEKNVKMRSRIFLVDGRLYQIVVFGSEGTVKVGRRGPLLQLVLR